VDFIIQHNIPEVVIACTDAYEKVNGSGIARLRDAGIKVITGVMEKEAIDLNKRFFTFHQEQRPYIILKWAQSKDIKVGGHDNKPVRISNEITDRLVHKWRSEEAAIMVGTNTALYDDPALTTRLWPGNDPVRIIIDRYLKVPQTAQLLDNNVPTIIVNTIKQEETGNLTFYKTGEDENQLAITINILRQRKLISLIVEGGSKLLQSFIDSDLWDEARVITSSEVEIGNGISAPVLKGHAPVENQTILSDRIDIYKNH
jgi:diaminohydroxyphosphoribosylaminopyrimidine deaminase/5-amino-6-(5-phosphoribosylamino)uracil reductase